ncbi:MAG: hypothetical protein U0228_28325 [Myxococcaceae bacterium]
MLTAAALAVALTLSQEPETPPAGDPAPAASPQTPGDAANPAAPAAPAGAPRPKGADDVLRVIQKLPSMTPAERDAAIQALQKQYGLVETNPVLPQDVDLDKYLGLETPQQVEVITRGFLTDLIGGDVNRMVARAGYPFFIEGKRYDRPEDLRTALSRSVRSRRTDLLKLYSIEALTPADMEKKYGKPPARLNQWGLRTGTTYLAVANLSGHATVLLLRQAGAAWQIVGFHD